MRRPDSSPTSGRVAVAEPLSSWKTRTIELIGLAVALAGIYGLVVGYPFAVLPVVVGVTLLRAPDGGPARHPGLGSQFTERPIGMRVEQFGVGGPRPGRAHGTYRKTDTG
jgi:hypothetical protein